MYITDRFMRHYSALGSFVRVYTSDIAQLTDVLNAYQQLGDVEVSMTGEDAAREVELTADVNNKGRNSGI
jgi:hypothetical protein